MEELKDEEKYYGFIYITTNNINGKKYIGQKKYLSQKWKTYLGSGIALNKAIDKYGKDNFTREIIENCITREELNEREKYWIKFYDATHSKDFYNIAKGGDGGWVNDEKPQEVIIEMYRKRTENHHQKHGEEVSMSKLKEVDVIEIINRLKNNDFDSDIANDYNVSPRTINDIRHHRTWCYLTEDIVFNDISTRKRPRGSKSIVQYDLFGNYIKKWDNARRIQDELGISFKQISQACNGYKLIVHKFVWRFENDAFDKYDITKSKYYNDNLKQ